MNHAHLLILGALAVSCVGPAGAQQAGVDTPGDELERLLADRDPVRRRRAAEEASRRGTLSEAAWLRHCEAVLASQAEGEGDARTPREVAESDLSTAANGLLRVTGWAPSARALPTLFALRSYVAIERAIRAAAPGELQAGLALSLSAAEREALGLAEAAAREDPSELAALPLLLLAVEPKGGEASRRAAAEALARTRGERAVEPLSRLLARKTESYDIRNHAATALGALGDAAAPALAAALYAGTADRDRLAWALARVGEAALPLLEDAARANRSDQTDVARRVRFEVEPERMSAVLADPRASGDERRAAAWELARGPTVRALTGLVAAVGDPDPQIRSEVMTALQGLGPHAAPAAPALVQQLLRGPEDDRHQVAAALLAIGRAARSELLSGALPDTALLPFVGHVLVAADPDDPGLQPALARALEERLPWIGLEADLAALGARAAPVAERFVEMLGQLDRRERVMRTMSRAGRPGLREALLALGAASVAPLGSIAASHASPEARVWAAELLAGLAPDEPEAARRARELLGDAGTRRPALEAVGYAAPDVDLVETVAKLLASDPEPAVRAAAAGALGRWRHAAACPLLAEALFDPVPGVQRAAGAALGEVGPGPEWIPFLECVAAPGAADEALAGAGEEGVRALLARRGGTVEASALVRRAPDLTLRLLQEGHGAQHARWILEAVLRARPIDPALAPRVADLLLTVEVDERIDLAPFAAAILPRAEAALREEGDARRLRAIVALSCLARTDARAVGVLSRGLMSGDARLRSQALSHQSTVREAETRAPLLEALAVVFDRFDGPSEERALLERAVGPTAELQLLTLAGERPCVAGRAHALARVARSATEGSLLRAMASEALVARDWSAERGATSLLPALALMTRDADARVRRSGLWALARLIATTPFGQLALPFLTPGLADMAPEVRRAAALALGVLGPAGVPAAGALAGLLRDQVPELRECAAFAIRQLGPTAIDAAPGLRAALGDDPILRPRVVDALVTLGPDAWRPAMASTDPVVRRALVVAMAARWTDTSSAAAGPSREAVAVGLQEALADPDVDVRLAALAQREPRSWSPRGWWAEAVDALGRLLADPDGRVRLRAAVHFARWPAGELARVVEPLERAAADGSDALLRLAALDALAQLEAPELRPRVTAAVVRAIADLDARVRLRGVALASGGNRFKEPEVVQALERAVADADPEVQREARSLVETIRRRR